MKKFEQKTLSLVFKDKLMHALTLFFLVSLFAGCNRIEKILEEIKDEIKDEDQVQMIDVPEGFKVEKVVGGLTYPTSMTWDDRGNMHVAEAGGGLNPEQLAPSRILQVKHGKTTEVARLDNQGVFASVVGLTWHHGAFYITHRAEDLTGAVSKVTKDGQVTKLFDGIIDSQSEHQINDIQVGPDDMLYVAVGPAGNAGIMDLSVAPWIMESPDVRTTACQDIVLLGKNFKTPDFRTKDPDDSVLTGAYVPFGTETAPGEVIQGVTLCGGSILKFDPNDPLGTIQTHAWGFRNLIGLTWDDHGQMYATENGYDVRGSRPVKDDIDASLKIIEGIWYGIPDYSAAREPLTHPKFEVPDSLQAGVFINGEFVGKDLGFLIDHEKSGLTPPDPSLVLGHHEVNSSPCLLDVAPASWDDLAGHVFIAEWGDLAPPTNPLRGKEPAEGYRVVKVNPYTGAVTAFVSNDMGGPASGMGMEGKGLERPFDVKFGPDGAMYIVDYGVVTIDMSLEPPYAYQAGTGVIWKVSKTK